MFTWLIWVWGWSLRIWSRDPEADFRGIDLEVGKARKDFDPRDFVLAIIANYMRSLRKH